jgi:hypothetical protein
VVLPRKRPPRKRRGRERSAAAGVLVELQPPRAALKPPMDRAIEPLEIVTGQIRQLAVALVALIPNIVAALVVLPAT